MTSELKTKKTCRIYGWNISRRVDRSIYSTKWDHSEDSPLSDGSTSRFKYEELIDDW